MFVELKDDKGNEIALNLSLVNSVERYQITGDAQDGDESAITYGLYIVSAITYKFQYETEENRDEDYFTLISSPAPDAGGMLQRG